MKPNRYSGMCRIYRLLLLLYPRGFRREFGDHMLQLFRDQCRDASAERGVGLARLWLRQCADLAFSAVREHISNLSHPMKSLRVDLLSVLLLILSLAMAFLGPLGFRAPVFPLFIIYGSVALLLVRAGVEWLRPLGYGESLKAIVLMVVLVFLYVPIMMVWRNWHLKHGVPPHFNPSLPLPAIFLNVLVPLVHLVRLMVKEVLRLVTRAH